MIYSCMEKTLFIEYSELERLFGPPIATAMGTTNNWCYWTVASTATPANFGYDNGACTVTIASYLDSTHYSQHTEWRLIGHNVTEEHLFKIISDVYVNKKASDLVKIINDYEAMSGE